MDQGSTMKRSAVHNFAPTVTKFCVMWEGQALPHDTKFGNSRCEIIGRRVIFIWSLIHGLRWSGLIKAEPGADSSLTPNIRQGVINMKPLWPRLLRLMCHSALMSYNVPTIYNIFLLLTHWYREGTVNDIFNTLVHQHSRRHFPDDIFKYSFGKKHWLFW